jgi:signal transduction histidine kinase
MGESSETPPAETADSGGQWKAFDALAEASADGIGLTFVTELANAYGWDCTIVSAEDGGARFEFSNVETPDDGDGS